MACVQEHRFCRTRGDTFPFTLTLRDSAGAAINITGTTFLLTVDPNAAPVDASGNLFQVSGVIVDGPNGIVSFTLSGPQAATAPGAYFFDVQWTSATVRTILRGVWEIEQDITK